MRSLKFLGPVLGALAAALGGGLAGAACGGRSVQIPDDDAGAALDAGPADVTVPDAGPPDVRGDALDCDALLKQIETGRELLTRCCSACAVPQCNVLADDLCCPLSYTSQGANPDVARAFGDLVRTYKRACPPMPCPAVVCPAQPSRDCLPQSGHCRSF
jgi:hypothetical protein